MSDPVWPVALPYETEAGAWSNVPTLAPLETEMEGGNTRSRPRPGDDVAMRGWARRFTPEQMDVWRPFLANTLAKGTKRFSMPVWNGTAYETRTVQIVRGGNGVNETSVARGLYTRVAFTVRVLPES